MPQTPPSLITRRQFLRRLGIATGATLGLGPLHDLSAIAQPARTRATANAVVKLTINAPATITFSVAYGGRVVSTTNVPVSSGRHSCVPRLQTSAPRARPRRYTNAISEGASSSCTFQRPPSARSGRDAALRRTAA